MHALSLLNILCVLCVSSDMNDFVAGLWVRLIAVLPVLALLSLHSLAQSNVAAPIIQRVEIGNGITLHYVDLGKGVPVIFDPRRTLGQFQEFRRHGSVISSLCYLDHLSQSRIRWIRCG